MSLNKCKEKKSVPDELYEYLNSHMPSSYTQKEKEIIRIIFTLGYHGVKKEAFLTSNTPLDIVYNCSRTNMISICENFVNDYLNETTELFTLISNLRKKIEKNIPLN